MLLSLVPAGITYAYTPGIQASIFNASMKKVKFSKAELIINKTKSLYSSLNSEEQLSMYGHGSLKIASYMFLVDFWREYSLQRVMAERGFHFKEEELKSYGIDKEVYSTPMKLIGSLNYSINSNCQEATNKSFTYNYIDLLKNIQALQPLVSSKEYSDGAQAALFFIKIYYYQRLHVANSTHTYTNNECLSDNNGLLTCASNLLDLSKEQQPRLELAKKYQIAEWNDFRISSSNQRRLQSCPITIWSYLQSGALAEPINDGEIVSASEAIIHKLDQKVLKKSESIDINSIMQDNADVMRFIYHDSGEDKATVLKGVVLTQIQIATLRSAQMIDMETFGLAK